MVVDGVRGLLVLYFSAWILTFHGFEKIVFRTQFANALALHKLYPQWMRKLLVRGVPLVEIAVALAAATQTGVGAAALACLFLVFLLFHLVLFLGRHDTGCACTSSAANSTWSTELPKSLLFFLLALVTFALCRQAPAPGVIDRSVVLGIEIAVIAFLVWKTYVVPEVSYRRYLRAHPSVG